MEKHAYLILAHSQFNLLKKLMLLLDDERNDIYLHIDAKVKEISFIKSEILPKIKYSNINFVQRHNVNWGGKSMIAAEYELLKAAIKNQYSYYHLISGVDLPLKSQDYIHKFFQENNGKEFVHFGTDLYCQRSIERYRYYWLFQDYVGRGNANFLVKVLDKFRRYFISFQKVIGINRVKEPYRNNHAAGSQWFSITDAFARHIVSLENEMLEMYKYSCCCDEVFIQNIIINSKFIHNIYRKTRDDDYISIMRAIDWHRGNPYTWKIDDYNELMASKNLFARKFDETQDEKIIEKIYHEVKSR